MRERENKRTREQESEGRRERENARMHHTATHCNTQSECRRECENATTSERVNERTSAYPVAQSVSACAIIGNYWQGEWESARAQERARERESHGARQPEGESEDVPSATARERVSIHQNLFAARGTLRGSKAA